MLSQWTPAVGPHWQTAAEWTVCGGECKTAGSRTQCLDAAMGYFHNQRMSDVKKNNHNTVNNKTE